jgi:hypothetical protein
MKDLGITKGKWEIEHDGTEVFVYAGEKPIFNEWIQPDSEANAVLFADAGNTAQKCGLLPSELLKQRNELLYALKLLKASYAMYDNLLNFDVSIALRAINNATK